MHHIHSKFRSDESGSIAILTALMIAVLLMAVGFAIDYTRIVSDRQHAQQALDASLLAGAVSYQGGSTKEEAKRAAENYLNANGNASLKYDVAYNFGDASITGKLKSATPTPIMSFFGYRDMKWNVAGEVGYSKPPAIDYSLALDISSSMEAGGHMEALRSALKDFSSSVFNGSKTGDVSVSLVPFANGVSFPPKYASWVNPAKGFIYGSFVGCFFPEARIPKASLTSTWPGNYRVAPDLVQAAQNNIFCPRPGTQISFYAESASQLDARTSTLESFQGTATADGLSWAWRTLEPNWKPVFGESMRFPRDHSKEYRKVIILFTDGLPYYKPWNKPKQTAQDKQNLRKAALDDFKAVCDAIKADGRFDLYTIGYGDSMSAEEQAALQGCVAGKGEFLRADRTNVSEVFKSIASTTAQIALRR